MSLENDYLEVIKRDIADHPRSKQQTIGPSEIGTPCDRKLGFKLARKPSRSTERVGWKPYLGTQLHVGEEKAFQKDNERLGYERWVTERKVLVGTILDEDIWGSCDLFDKASGTVIDHKHVWKTSMDKYTKAVRNNEIPSAQYLVQAQLYGRGYELLGYEVNNVAVMFLPMAGELEPDHLFWSVPYDREVGKDALAHAEAILTAGRTVGWSKVLPKLDRVDDYCRYCPWFDPSGSVDESKACPGAQSAVDPGRSMLGL